MARGGLQWIASRWMPLAAALFVAACHGGGSDDEPAPVAAFTASPVTGTFPLTVAFDASGSTRAASYRWEFGESTPPETGVRVSHVFTAARTFTVTLVVANSRGVEASATRTIDVATREMPNLVGMTEAQAAAALAAAGFSVERTTRVVNPVEPLGTVVSQTPGAGPLTMMPTVTLGLSTPLDVLLGYPDDFVAVPDNARIVVEVDAVYEVAEVTASVGGATTAMTFRDRNCARPYCGNFVGDVLLAGQPRGRVTLEARARDIRGHEATAQLAVTHDNPPQLTVVEPLGGSVSFGTLPINVLCTDDSQVCRLDLTIAGQNFASADGGLLQTVDVGAFVGRAVPVEIRARDDRNLTTIRQLTVYVESPAALSVVEDASSPILAAADTRILYLVRGATGDSLIIRDRVTDAEQTLSLAAGSVNGDASAHLVSNGAVFVTGNFNTTSQPARVMLWRLGTLIDVGPISAPSLLDVAGDFAVFNHNGTVSRLDAGTGAATVISTGVGYTESSVAADGTAVFVINDQLYRDRAGVRTQLTNDSSHRHYWPHTDGVNTLFVKSARISLLADSTEIPLLTSDSPNNSDEYALTDGWAAFTDLGSQQQRHIFVRDPSGNIERRTDFADSSRVRALAGNGELMFENNSMLYHSDGVRLKAISSNNAKPVFINGGWYLILGRSLLLANTG